MNIQNIISIKFDLNSSTLFSYKCFQKSLAYFATVVIYECKNVSGCRHQRRLCLAQLRDPQIRYDPSGRTVLRQGSGQNVIKLFFHLVTNKLDQGILKGEVSLYH
jgi:hypothetical protein